MSNNKELMLSIIVPIYNVEEYLFDCLESIEKSINNIDAEVLLIDDGSKDSSSDIAKEYIKTHGKFKYYRKENGGLSDTRNYGAKKASGKYISFVDSDDLVTEDMYENMIASAELNDTDFTIINVARVDSKHVFKASLYERVFCDLEETVTHITECDNLIYDTITCNKLIRRSFWVENGFEYPVGWRFEDLSVSLAMHCQARRISIVRTVGYLWRVRDGETKSITQQNGSIINLRHRLAMIDRMFRYIEEEMNGDERLKKLLSEKVLSLDLLIYVNALGSIPEEEREEYRGVLVDYLNNHYRREDWEGLQALRRQKYVDLVEKRYDELEPLIKYSRFNYYTAPVVMKDSGRKVELLNPLFDKDYYDFENELYKVTPVHAITDIGYTEKCMWLDMFSFTKRINTREGNQEIKVSLLNVVTGTERELEVFNIDGNDVSVRFGHMYDLYNGNKHSYDYSGSAFRVFIDPDTLDEGSYGKNVLHIRYKNPAKTGCYYVQSGQETDLSRFAGEAIRTGSCSVTVSLDEQGCVVINVAKTDMSRQEAAMGAWPEDCNEVVQIVNDTEQTASMKVRVQGLNQLQKDSLIKLEYWDKIAGKNVLLSSGLLQTDADGSFVQFTVDFTDREILKNLYVMRTPLTVCTEGSEECQALYAGKTLHQKFRSDMLQILLMANMDGLIVLDVRKNDDDTINKRKYLRTIRYPELRDEPINEKMILFESYWGDQYSCNPRALYEYIDAKHPEYTCVWSLLDERTPINGNGIRVRKWSEEYYRCLATAKYLVNNVNFENSYKKKAGQIEIQTMHGTPYKTIGLDVKEEFPTEKDKLAYIRKNRRWNYLIAQGTFTAENARRWYSFNKNVLRTGYPRTDRLFASDFDVNKIKEELGLPLDKKIVLYAPTFRKQGVFEMPLDLEYLRSKLADEYILLIRLHHFAAGSYKIPQDKAFIFDACGYSNIETLYKIADIMVTDYSSVMFDFALTGKPMIFYTYDLEEYESKTRGVYFDIRTEAPGMIVMTNEELADAILTGGFGEEERVKRFKEKYLTYECGNSCEKVFEEAIKKTRTNRLASLRLSAIKVAKAIIPKKAYRKIRKNRLKRDFK